MAYTRFVTERAGLTDQEALAGGVSKLTDRMDAVSIGSLHRTAPTHPRRRPPHLAVAEGAGD
jgi:hypothetical protein